MQIEIISGSPRANSLSRRVAIHLLHHISIHTEHEAGLIDVRNWPLPPINAVFTSVEETPRAFKELSERMFQADAFILVSPEYNGSYSADLKNLLDHFPKQHHKPFGIATASPGSMGGIRAALQLQSLVTSLFGIASPYMLLVPAVDQKIDSAGNLVENKFAKQIQHFTDEFLWLAEKVVDVKELI